MQLYQEPGSYKDIIPQNETLQQSMSAAKYVSPAEVSVEMRPVGVGNFCGAYDHEELTVYLRDLQQHLTGPTSLMLTSSNHSINLNFDPTLQQWILVDANNLPGQVFTREDTVALAQKIISSFDAGRVSAGYAIFNTSMFVCALENTRLEQNLASLHSSASWNSIHEVTEEKSLVHDAFNAEWSFIAAQNGHLEVLKFLAEKGANLNAPNAQGATPAFIAAQNGHLEVLKFLAEKGVNLNTPNAQGITPAHFAALKGHLKVLKFLAENGADLNIPLTDGQTPAHIAAQNDHLEVLKWLAEKGANLDIPNAQGLTPADLAVQNNHFEVLTFLAENGANLNSVNAYLATLTSQSSRYLAIEKAITIGNIKFRCKELLKEIETHLVKEDYVLNSFIQVARCNLYSDSLDHLGALERELTQALPAVSSREVVAVKKVVQQLREEAARQPLVFGKRDKADKIERALYDTPVLERNNVVTHKGASNAVQDALALHSSLWKKNPVKDSDHKIIETDAAKTFKRLKQELTQAKASAVPREVEMEEEREALHHAGPK